jgi:AraC-like DNA-binding protein
MNERKEKAIKLRKKGYSYNMISEKLGISKSTLSCWFKEMPFTPNKQVIERIKRGPFKSGQIRHNQRVKDIAKIKGFAREELGMITGRDLWMVGLGLYIGEGSKAYEASQIINSDPEIIKLAIRWFNEVCKISNDNITITMYLYPDNDDKECINYWRKITGLPIKQFRKTQIDRRINKSDNKRRKLPYGTVRLSIISNGNSDFGVNLHRRIMGWIESIFKQI